MRLKRMILALGLLSACSLLPPPTVAFRAKDLSSDVDRIAAVVLDQAQPKSFAGDREYCGLIGYDSAGKLFATAPSPGEQNRCIPRSSANMKRIMASYHTHGAATRYIDTEAPSPEDLFADLSEGIDGYVATPGGRLWKVDHMRKAAYLICPKGCVRPDPRHKECAKTVPAGYQTRHTLEERRYMPKPDCNTKKN